MGAQTATAQKTESFLQTDSARMLARGADYLPVTFADRGVAISFTTPKLNQARVRMSKRETMELLVPDFADSGGTYVFPWSALPEMIGMTLHDRELHKLISEKPGVTPWEIRRMQMEIGARGLAGPVAAQACTKALGEDDRLRLAANLALIQKVFGFLGFETGVMKASNFLSPETQMQVRRAFQALGKEIQASPEQCYSAIAEQSVSLAQIGVPGADQPGRLRRIVLDMQSLTSSIKGWATSTYSECATTATMIGRVAEQTAFVANYDLDRLDKRISNIASFVKNWQREAREVRDLVSRMSWLLDGWDHINAIWFTAVRQSDNETFDAIKEIERILPHVPRKEVEDMPALGQEPEKLNGNRRVGAMQDWRSKSRDSDMIRRLEDVKGVAI